MDCRDRDLTPRVRPDFSGPPHTPLFLERFRASAQTHKPSSGGIDMGLTGVILLPTLQISYIFFF